MTIIYLAFEKIFVQYNKNAKVISDYLVKIKYVRLEDQKRSRVDGAAKILRTNRKNPKKNCS